jgi:hypothetical protein
MPMTYALPSIEVNLAPAKTFIIVVIGVDEFLKKPETLQTFVQDAFFQKKMAPESSVFTSSEQEKSDCWIGTCRLEGTAMKEAANCMTKTFVLQ